MSEPISDFDKKLLKLVVATADEFAAKLRRLHTVDPKMADDFYASYIHDSEMAFAVWTEGEGKRVCYLLLRRPTSDPSGEGIAAVWVESRAIAEALKKKMERTA
jgi:hypothetical protein